jgi:hypothetical protein
LNPKTISQYNEVISRCREVFQKKIKDYGTSWRVLRLPSLTDQLYIKANRIRTLDETGINKVGESIEGEYMAMVNYGIIALIQIALKDVNALEIDFEKALSLYNQKIDETRDLMMAKNHDYGEAWREMRIGSFTDLILTKLLRIKQIEANDGKTIISEGIDANYQDIINYSVFALIKMKEQQD